MDLEMELKFLVIQVLGKLCLVCSSSNFQFNIYFLIKEDKYKEVNVTVHRTLSGVFRQVKK